MDEGGWRGQRWEEGRFQRCSLMPQAGAVFLREVLASSKLGFLVGLQKGMQEEIENGSLSPFSPCFQGGTWYGVDINNEDIADNFEAFVWEPAMVRINALIAASEAACLIVSIDETIKNPRSTVDVPAAAGRGRDRGRLH